MAQYVCTVGPKGQVTLPIEVRRQLGIEPSDKVYVVIEDQKVVVRRAIGSVMDLAGSVRPLKVPISDRELRDIAAEGMAQEAVRRGQP